MLKLILCTLIISSGVGIGMLKAQTFTNRENHLQELISVLKVIEADMAYRLDPIPELFARVGEKSPGYAGDFFLSVCRKLKSPGENIEFTSAWNQGVEEIYGASTLTGEDISVIKEIGIDLGKTDIGGQKGLFQHAYGLLEKQRCEAEEDKRTKGKMYKGLGSALGILIVIILI